MRTVLGFAPFGRRHLGAGRQAAAAPLPTAKPFGSGGPWEQKGPAGKDGGLGLERTAFFGSALGALRGYVGRVRYSVAAVWVDGAAMVMGAFTPMRSQPGRMIHPHRVWPNARSGSRALNRCARKAWADALRASLISWHQAGRRSRQSSRRDRPGRRGNVLRLRRTFRVS